MSKVLVCSDQHLGYTYSKTDDFRKFLDQTAKRTDIGTLVLLGDLVDMWRRDVSGLFLEYSDLIDRLSNIGKAGIKIYIIAGNHDYHLLKLKDPVYQYEFYKELDLPSSTGGLQYKFRHGYEFDLAQREPLMEALCHNMSDEAGDAKSMVYSLLTGFKDHFSDLISFHGGNEALVNHLMTSPETRLKPYLTKVEARACRYVKDNEVLIFGHTHRPFVSKDRRVVNTGSWISEPHSEYVFNTFVELDGDNVKLLRYVDGNTEDITDKNTFPCPTENDS
jgi:UDP-2,3-diacylglucosamine pyrophosphatase LpxH